MIRQKDKSIAAFANVCAHRCAKLLEGKGYSTRISCPYHSWTYALDGQLIGPPSPNFNKSDYRLAPVRSETWDTNWKCLVDNFMDTMHIHRVHK
ncbi:MAG: phenylpropionate dioxygenase-like ring-hydroxylating dioxygenase large terminal subunit [Gammaproteobacteria bacterium]